MFILNLTYIKPISDVETHLENHRKFLQKYYDANKIICSGRKNPRIGGVILCTANDIDEVNSIIKEDPFYTENIAEYEIIEFTPTNCVDEFKAFI